MCFYYVLCILGCCCSVGYTRAFALNSRQGGLLPVGQWCAYDSAVSDLHRSNPTARKEFLRWGPN
jgi:hypothetical protein